MAPDFDSSLDFSDDSLPPIGLDAEDEATYAPGATLGGRYELVSCMGRGGMGSVWRAIDHTLQACVAVKLVRPRILDAAGPMAMARILREARAAASVAHPGIVQTFDVGIEEGRPYIVMELLEGQSLEERLDEVGRLCPEDSVRVLIPLLRALACAHAQGVVHRDIKPSNVMLVPTDEGHHAPKLLDFGVARQMEDDQRITQTGQLLGTPAYMSYEQATGATDVDARSDLWAVAAVAYELMAGLPPFDGDNYNAVLTSILTHRFEPLNRVATDVDPELAAIVARGLMPRRDDRWPDATAMLRAFEAWLLGQGVTSDITGHTVGRTDTPKPRRRKGSLVPTLEGLPATQPPTARHTAQAPRVVMPPPEDPSPRSTLGAVETRTGPPPSNRLRPWHAIAAAAVALGALTTVFVEPEVSPDAKAGLVRPMVTAATTLLVSRPHSGPSPILTSDVEGAIHERASSGEETSPSPPASTARTAPRPAPERPPPAPAPAREPPAAAPLPAGTTWAGGVPLPTDLR